MPVFSYMDIRISVFCCIAHMADSIFKKTILNFLQIAAWKVCEQ